MRTLLSKMKVAVRRVTWRFSPPSMQYVVALIGRLGIGTVEDLAQHFNVKVDVIDRLFQEARDAKLISRGRHLRIEQAVFLPTEKGLQLAAQEGLLTDSLMKLGPCRIGPRNVIRWMTRMRAALEFERLGLEVTNTLELRAENRLAHSDQPAGQRSKPNRVRCRYRSHRPDLRVRASVGAPSIAVNIQFIVPLSKRDRRQLLRHNQDASAIWFVPPHLAQRMQLLQLAHARRSGVTCLGVRRAVRAARAGASDVFVPLNAANRCLLPAKRRILPSWRHVPQRLGIAGSIG